MAYERKTLRCSVAQRDTIQNAARIFRSNVSRFISDAGAEAARALGYSRGTQDDPPSSVSSWANAPRGDDSERSRLEITLEVASCLEPVERASRARMRARVLADLELPAPYEVGPSDPATSPAVVTQAPAVPPSDDRAVAVRSPEHGRRSGVRG